MATHLIHPDVAAEMLSVPVKKIRALVHLSELEGVRVGGPRSLRITLASIERFVERHRVGGAR